VNSIISDPYGKTLLNSDRSIQIESRIYTIFESGLMVMIGNEDISTYNANRNISEAEIAKGFNVRLIGVTGDKINDYYYTTAGGQIISTKRANEVVVGQRYDNQGNIQLVNNSFIEYSDESTPTFKWVYP